MKAHAAYVVFISDQLLTLLKQYITSNRCCALSRDINNESDSQVSINRHLYDRAITALKDMSFSLTSEVIDITCHQRDLACFDGEMISLATVLS